LRLKILKTLRTASLSAEFTGSYKKSVVSLHDVNVMAFSSSFSTVKIQ